MYNVKKNLWESAAYEEEVIRWAKEPANEQNPGAVYVLADLKLAEANGTSGAAEPVWLMEKAANLHYEPASFAMAQLYHYGWCVDQDLHMALKWYGISAGLGNKEAARIADELKEEKSSKEKPQKEKKPKKTVGILIAAAVILAALIIAVVLWQSSGSGVEGVLVGEDTTLIEAATVEEFNEALSDLIGQYDDELVISGQQSTNRLLLAFEGDGIDLSAFPAATVIADEENYVVIQFETEEDAAECLETLINTEGVLFVEEDAYSTSTDAASDDESDTFVLTESDFSSSGVPYTSSYTGYTYLTWGAEFLGMDQLAAWLMTQDTREVTVAVVDTGIELWEEMQDRVLEGTDITGNSENGCSDTNGHGTHVSGIILQCTQGLDVKILPVRIFGSEGSTSDSNVIQGIKYAIESDVDVINFSVGSSEHSDAKEYYVQEAVSEGIVFVNAAGNDAVDTQDACPSHLEEAIIVSAIDDTGTVTYFSNYGDSVDVAAPGAEVISYYIEGQYAELDGTSQAAPHIAALAAMMLTLMPDKTPSQIENYIKSICVDAGDSDYYGAGIPWGAYLADE